jgi:hypothetical protein
MVSSRLVALRDNIKQACHDTSTQRANLTFFLLYGTMAKVPYLISPFYQCWGSVPFFDLMDPDPDPTPNPTPFFNDFKDAKKNLIFFLYLTRRPIIFSLKN